MSAVDSLDKRLRLATDAILDAQALEHELGMASRQTRKLPADALRTPRHWRALTETAAATATLSDKSGARAPLSGQPEAGTQINVCPEELPNVPAGEITSVRVPLDLRQQAEAYGRERRWKLSEVVRVGLEQLVDSQPRNGEAEAELRRRREAGDR